MTIDPMTSLAQEHDTGNLGVSVASQDSLAARSIIDRLPTEVLSDCLVGFSLEELLRLRLVSKAWLVAVSLQDVYSRDIDYWPSEASLHEMPPADEIPHRPISLDLLKARIICSERNVRLRVCTRCLPDATTAGIIELIRTHLHRMEVLWIGFLADLSDTVFSVLQKPVTRLRDLYLDVAHARYILPSFDEYCESDAVRLVSFSDVSGELGSIPNSQGSEARYQHQFGPEIVADPADLSSALGAFSDQPLLDIDPYGRLEDTPETNYAVRVPPTIFAGEAPVLQKLSLGNCALDPLEAYPAFSGVKRLKLLSDSQDCVSPAHMLTVSPLLESLDVVSTCESSFHPSPRADSITSVPRLRLVRIEGTLEQNTAILSGFTSADTPVVTISSLDEQSVLTLFRQLHGRGPFTFMLYTDERRDFLWLYMLLVSASPGAHVRGVEVHSYDHWHWEWDEPRVLEFFGACALAADITAIHVGLRNEGVGALAMLGGIRGAWPAVRTVRIDVLTADVPVQCPVLDCTFPVLVQVVLCHPFLPPSATEYDIQALCAEFLGFFRSSDTDSVTVVLTRDFATAELVAADPAAAAGHSQCAVCSWKCAGPRFQ